MTNFTTLSDTTLAQDKPLTQSIARAWRDNPLAIQQGNSTAPTTLGLNPDVEVTSTSAAALAYTGGFDSAYTTFDVMLSGVSNVSSSATNLYFEYTTNGGTSWSGATSLVSFSLVRESHAIFQLKSPTVANSQVLFGYMATSEGTTSIKLIYPNSASAINGIRFRYDTGNIKGTMTIRRWRRAANVG